MIREMSKAASMQAVRGRRLTSRDGLTAWLLVAPAIVCIVALFVVPIGYVLLLSVTDPTVSLDHYRRFFTVPLYSKVMLNTFRTSLIVTLACLALGYPLAYVMARRNDAVAIVLLVAVGLSFWTGFVVRTYAWLVILGNKGPVAATYALAGWGKPPQLLFTSFSSTLGMTHVLLPYMVLALYGVMRKIDPPICGRRKAWRPPVRGVPPGVPAAQPAGRGQRLRPRVHHVPRFLHHPDPARHAQGHDDLPAHQPADRGPAGLGLRLGDRGGPARVHARPARRLHRFAGLDRLWGDGDGAACSARAGRARRDLPRCAVGDHRTDVVLQGDLVRIPPPSYWTGYYGQYFANRSWLDATANSFIIAFGSTVFTLVAALPPRSASRATASAARERSTSS
jgi:ABC-type spermidine/putrescine transport system permease subunit I